MIVHTMCTITCAYRCSSISTHTHTLTDVVLLTAAVVVALREELVSGFGFGRLKALLLLYVLAWSDDRPPGGAGEPNHFAAAQRGRHSLTH